MNRIVPSKTARQAIALAFKNHWRFRVVGVGEPPKEPVYKDEWWYSPIIEKEVPDDAMKRLDALRRAGIGISGVIIAHESPRLLTAPKEPQKTFVKQPMRRTDPQLILEVLGFIIAMFFQALLLDPAIVVVLEDGTWLEVMTWYE